MPSGSAELLQIPVMLTVLLCKRLCSCHGHGSIVGGIGLVYQNILHRVVMNKTSPVKYVIIISTIFVYGL